MLPKIFSHHPASVGETYGEHLATASGFGLRMIAGGFACMVHGLLPFAFEKTGSNQIRMLHERMVTNRDRNALINAPAPAHEQGRTA
jgi:hypothetical protein